jgi:[acyl-carrier-protein] S-malonyltransferase
MGTAFLLAGQGSQKVGMGMDLAAACEDCRRTMTSADAALDCDLTQIMAHGPEEELAYTGNAQPAILCLSVAQARHLQAQGIRADILAGHSLGIYSALVVAGALEFHAALRLVAARGRLMQETVPLGKGAMMAIVGLDRELVYEAVRTSRSSGVVNVAGHNSPGQTVISGEVAAVERAAEFCEEEGGGIVPLKVSAPFHCDLMAPMLPKFARLIHDTPLNDLKIPVIDDVTGKPFPSTAAIRKSLIAQITSPILFEEGLRYMVSAGANRFIQCGPGKSLLNFAHRVAPNLDFCTFEEAAWVPA